MLRCEDILDAVFSYNPGADLALIRKGYVFSAKVHKGQTRLSGEVYLSHPLAVAGILTELGLDVPAVVAGLLHDTVEDTHATLGEVEELFGEEVASLVDGMTKISTLDEASLEERQAENVRKMILAMVHDIRVILIKLADRLHNMRTLEYLPRRKQLRIAEETSEIYAPIAHRLGLGLVHRELRDLCLRYTDAEAFRQIEEGLPQERRELEGYAREIDSLIQEKIRTMKIRAEVEARTSSISGIHRKMVSRKIPFERVFDVIRIKVFTERLLDCYTLLGVIHTLWKPVPGKFEDFIGVPKTNEYQSLHTLVMGHKGHPVHFQVLTRDMQRLADRGITAQWKYKKSLKESPEERAERLFWLKSLLQWQQELLDSREFLASVKKDLYAEVIYVFTPKGEVRELPKGATPIDFAFHIHSEIGNKTVGCRVNGRDVSLDFTLRNGDAVQILTSEGQTPQREWLRFAKTPRARTRIKEWLRGREKERSVEFGRSLLRDTLERYHVDATVLDRGPELEELVLKLGFHDREKFLENVGYGKVSPLSVVEKLLPSKEFKKLWKKEEKQRKKTGQAPPATGIHIRGRDDIFVHLASCCNPVPGDRIIAFIGEHRGVTVHEIGCPLASDLDVNPERRIEVAWDPEARVPRSVKVRILAVDRPGVLAEICGAITAQGANIGKTQIQALADKTAQCDFEIQVLDRQQLDAILEAVRKNKTVRKAERLKGVDVTTLPAV